METAASSCRRVPGRDQSCRCRWPDGQAEVVSGIPCLMISAAFGSPAPCQSLISTSPSAPACRNLTRDRHHDYVWPSLMIRVGTDDDGRSSFRGSLIGERKWNQISYAVPGSPPTRLLQPVFVTLRRESSRRRISRHKATRLTCGWPLRWTFQNQKAWLVGSARRTASASR